MNHKEAISILTIKEITYNHYLCNFDKLAIKNKEKVTKSSVTNIICYQFVDANGFLTSYERSSEIHVQVTRRVLVNKITFNSNWGALEKNIRTWNFYYE